MWTKRKKPNTYFNLVSYSDGRQSVCTRNRTFVITNYHFRDLFSDLERRAGSKIELFDCRVKKWTSNNGTWMLDVFAFIVGKNPFAFMFSILQPKYDRIHYFYDRRFQKPCRRNRFVPKSIYPNGSLLVICQTRF